jgi:aminoglycoside 3-N-acetyltransferase
MSELETIKRTPSPVTVSSLTADLRRCGLKKGQTVFVQIAMSKLGWVAGGPEAIIMALLDAIGEMGTIMMSANSGSNTDPANWESPPVPENWWQIIRENTPGFNPATTPSRGVGKVPELFRTWPGTLRSNHPAYSIAANGPQAEYLTANHPLDDEAGEESPIGRLYNLDGYVMLIGVTHDSNSSLHLAEARANYPGKKSIHSGSAILVDGKQAWAPYQINGTYGEDFELIGKAYDIATNIEIQKINHAEVRFFKQRSLVDFAVKWMEANRDYTK